MQSSQKEELPLGLPGNKTSLGNKYTLQQQTRYSTKSQDVIPKPVLSMEECIAVISEVSQCCGRRLDRTNCFFKHFENSETKDIKVDEACHYLRKIRSLSQFKNKEEYCSFVGEMFNKSVTGEKKMSNGDIKYNHSFQLPDGQDVCRDVFRMAFGFSKDELDNCSKLRKQSSNGRIAFKKHFTSYTDGYLPDNTYHEVDDIFFQNLGHTGKRILLFDSY